MRRPNKKGRRRNEEAQREEDQAEAKSVPVMKDDPNEDNLEPTSIDIYGEDPNKEGLLSKTRGIAGAVLGDLVAETLFGQDEGPYHVPSDFSRFEAPPEADTATAPSARAQTTQLNATVKTLAAPTLLRVPGGDSAAVTFAEDLLRLRATACRPTKEGEEEEEEAAVGKKKDKTGDADSSRSRVLGSPAEAPALAAALHQLCAAVASAPASSSRLPFDDDLHHNPNRRGTDERGGPDDDDEDGGDGVGESVQLRTGGLVGVLAGACHDLSTTLLRVEYELKRTQWRKQHPAATASADGESNSATEEEEKEKGGGESTAQGRLAFLLAREAAQEFKANQRNNVDRRTGGWLLEGSKDSSSSSSSGGGGGGGGGEGVVEAVRGDGGNKACDFHLKGGGKESGGGADEEGGRDDPDPDAIVDMANVVGAAPPTFGSEQDEELWVMDQLDAVLSKSRTTPAIFWALLEERRELLGFKEKDYCGALNDRPASGEGGSFSSRVLAVPGNARWPSPSEGSSGSGGSPWQLTTAACFALTGVGSLWVVPALYERLGTPFLVAASLTLQLPPLVLGCGLWRDSRTAKLGEGLVVVGAALTPLTALSVEALGLSLGFYKGQTRDWFPHPFETLLLDFKRFPHNAFACALSTALVSLLTFALAADAPWLGLPLVAGLACGLRLSSWHRTLVFQLNALVLGPGKMGLHQDIIWVDLGASLVFLLAVLMLLLLSFLLEPSPPPASSSSSTLRNSTVVRAQIGASTTAPPTIRASGDEDESDESAQLVTMRGAPQGSKQVQRHESTSHGRRQQLHGDKAAEHARVVKLLRYRSFLALCADCAALLAWASFSRLDKGHSEFLEMSYGVVNALMIVLALLTKRKALLAGVFGLGWYQGYRAVDVFSRSPHYAKSLLLFDHLCVFVQCVDPLKSRPAAW